MSDFTSHEAAAHEAASIPAMIPPKLVGREPALAQVYTQLKAGKPVMIYGSAGVGKTALAATLANAYAQQPGGVLWFNVNNDSLETLLVRVGRAYNVTEVTSADNPLAMVGAIAATLTQYKPFVVLDGPLDAQVAAKFITRCADRLPALILHRDEIDGPWTTLNLAPLDDASGVALYKLESAQTTNAADADNETLVKTLGNLPFAIGVAARAMIAAKQTPAAYGNVLAQVMTTQNTRPAQTALTASFAALNGALQGVVLIMGATFTGEASAELLSLISGAPAESIQQAMKLLVPLHLVEQVRRYDENYYRLHPLVYAFAQDRLKTSNRLDDLQQKVLDQTAAYAKKYAAGSSSFAFDRLAMEMDNFLAAVRFAAANGKREIAAEIATALAGASGFANNRGYSHEISAIRSLATGSSAAFPAYPYEVAAVRPEDEETETPNIFAMLDEIDEDIDEGFDDDDYDEDDLDDYDEDDLDEDEDTFSDLLDDLADVGDLDVDDLDLDEDDLDEDDLDENDDDEDEDLDDDYDDDEDYLPSTGSYVRPMPEDAYIDEDALEDVDENESNDLGIAEDADELTRLRAQLGAARQSGDQREQVRILQSIAREQTTQGMNNEAIATYGEMLNIYEAIGDKRGTLDTVRLLSGLMEQTKNAQAAVLHASRGVTLADELGESDAKMRLQMILGDARQQLGESEDAAEAYGGALALARESGDRLNQAMALYKLGYAQLDNGDATTAVQTWEAALELFRLQDKRDFEGKVLGGLGSAYGELERWAEAINFHTSALYIAREVGDKEEEALQLSSLGYACVQGDQLAQAVLRYRQALHLAFEADDRDNIVSTVVDLVRLLLRAPMYLEICEMLVEAALEYEPQDKDLNALEERIGNELMLARANNVDFKPVKGSAQTYAENAYKLLEA